MVLEGCGIGKTIITGALAASEILGDGMKRGTFRTYTAFFAGPRVELRNLTIENKAGFQPPEGIGEKAMQAVALYAAAERMFCRKVELSGFQDTLFLAPLPEEEREVGGFRGPGEASVRSPTLQFYEDCIVSGSVDFVFGGAAALFRNCKFIVRNSHSPEKNFYVAAPCSDSPFGDADCSSGFFFEDSVFMAETAGDSAYLARPWRPFGRCLFYGCSIGKGFSPVMWHVWNSDDDMRTAGFYSSGMKNESGEALFVKDWGAPLDDDDKKELLDKIKKMIEFEKNYKKNL